jgi:hypothetical protein
VVLSEIHYQPTRGDAEFVEIQNITDQPIALYDPEAPTNTWRIAGVDFSFPPNTVLPPRGFAVVTAGDPDLFRARFGLETTVPVSGPYTGVLQDGGETVVLQRPDKPDSEAGATVVPYIAVDAVNYDNNAPWPQGTAGGGASLERRSPVSYADDPVSWRASPGEPSPGGPNDGNRVPQVDAGSDLEIESALFPTEFALNGTGSDDGLPNPPGQLAFAWSQVSGPGMVSFANTTRSNATVLLPGTGVFTLRLTASDGDRSRADDIVITVRRPAEVRPIVAAGAMWRYLDDGSDQGTAWVDPDFNDTSWRSGAAELGFGDGGEQSVIRSTAGGTKIRTFYFRHTFPVADPASVTTLAVRLVRDDGALVYLNGEMVFRSNMPEGTVIASTWASEVVGSSAESTFFEQSVDPSLLTAGSNVLAVEVHQQNVDSTDVSFDLELVASITAVNRPPVADAGEDRETTLAESILLSAGYQDDGLPSPPGVVQFEWGQLEGPALASFSATNVPAPTVSFPVAGRYLLQLTVTDGEFVATDQLEVSVLNPQADYENWRAQFFTHGELQDAEISGEQADPDADGQPNRAEYLSGTHPRDAASVLRLSAKVESGGGVRLVIPVISGRTYSVLRRRDADQGTWEQIHSTAPQPCDCEIEIADHGAAAEGSAYYRVVTPASP